MTPLVARSISSRNPAMRPCGLLCSGVLGWALAAGGGGLAETARAQSSAAEPKFFCGFEEGTAGWRDDGDRGMSQAVPEAARTGDSGLRITDEDSAKGSNLQTTFLEAVPGSRYEVTFWARCLSGGGAGVYLRFLNAQKKLCGKPPVVAIPASAGDWQEFSLTATAPADTMHVSVWIHSFAGSTVTVDIDDLELRDVP